MAISPPYDLTPEPVPLESADQLGDSRYEQGVFDGAPPALIHNDWTKVALGIVLAGASYALLLAGSWAAITFFAVVVPRLLDGRSSVLAELLPGVMSLVVFGIAFAGAGAMWSAMVLIFALPLTYVFAWSMKLRGSMVWLGAVLGGLTGFLATVPLTLNAVDSITGRQTSEWQSALLALAIGPGLATVIGQIGGAWGGWNSASREARYQEAVRRARYVPVGSEVEAHRPDPSASVHRPWLQFGIRHMLWAAVWFSLLFSVMRLSGFDLAIALPVMLGWVGFQMITLWLGTRIWQRLNSWYASRRESLHVKQSAG